MPFKTNGKPLPSPLPMWSKMTSSYFPLFSQKIGLQPSRWLGLFVGAFAVIAATSCSTFFVWQNAMRAILDQCEVDSNLMNQLGNVGFFLAFPAGMVYEHWGSQANTAIGTSLTSLSFLILAITTDQVNSPNLLNFAKTNSWFVCLLWFFNGFGGNFIYMAALMPNMQNFHQKQRGKAIGFIVAACSVGPTLFSVMYNEGFTHGFYAPGEEAKQDLSGFFYWLAGINTFVGIFLFLFCGRLPQMGDEEKQPVIAHKNHEKQDGRGELSPSSTESSLHQYASTGHLVAKLNRPPIIEPKPPSQFSEFRFADLPIQRLINRPNFYLFSLQYCLLVCCQMTFQSNLSCYLRSFDLAQHNLLFMVVNTSLQAAMKFVVGSISDMVAPHYPRSVVFLAPYLLQAIALIICAFHGDEFNVLLFACICVGIGGGAAWSQSPVIIGDLFGNQYLASNWGWVMLLNGICGFPFTLGFGAIYEAAIPQEHEIYCYGLDCFKWSFVLLAGGSFAAFIAAFGLTQNMSRSGEMRKKGISPPVTSF